jgi:23S rRNA G2445 N2-methylase RlmL
MIQKITFLCDKGLEEFVQMELEERYKIKSTFDKFVSLNINIQTAYDLMYTMQTINGCVLTLNQGEFKSLEDINVPFEKLKEIIQNQTCKIEVERQGEHTFNSVEAEKIIGVTIQKNTDLEYDFKNPEIIIKLIINQNDYLLGIDLAGRDLSKRQYKIFNHPNNIKAPIAFSAILLAGVKNNLLDPYSLSGTIPIEAAIYQSQIPINNFEKIFALNKIKSFNINSSEIKIKKIKPKKIFSLDDNFKNLSAQKKNAKIAGVDKFINFSRIKLEDLDLKFYDEKPDVMVTMPLQSSKRISIEAEKSYMETLEKQAELILKKKIMVFISKKQINFIKKYKLTKQVIVNQGMQPIYLSRFEK